MRNLFTCEGSGTDDDGRTVQDLFTACGMGLATRYVHGRRDHLAIYAGCELFARLCEYRARSGEIPMVGDDDKLFGIKFYADFDMPSMSWKVTEVP